MEKQRKNRKIKFCNGLLKIFAAGIFVLCMNMPAEAQRLTYNIIKELTVKAVNSSNFSGTDCAFELKIPYTKSENVQAQIPDLPNGVNFVSLRRSEYSDSESGTKIELWLNFADSGTYRIRSLKVYINNRLYYLPFEPIVISENPRNILPQLVVRFKDGFEMIQTRRGTQNVKKPYTASVGRPLKFTVFLQYGVQVVSFDYKVPKNALFREIERFDITKGTVRSSEYTEEKIPIAKFEWEPLYSGNQILPELNIVATSYNGVRVELHLPEIPINVVELPLQKHSVTDGEELFGYAFTKKAVQQKKTEKISVSVEDCEKIAQLRMKERKSIPFTKEYKERKEFEENVGIAVSAFEPTYFSMKISFVFAVLFLVFLVLMIFLKKLHGIITFSAFFMISIVCLVITFVQISETYAIFKGGNISPVPEFTSSSVASIESGKRVRIEQKAGGWVFVQFGNSGGWVKESEVIFIKGESEKLQK